MKNLLKYQWYKVAHNRLTYVIFLLCSGIALLFTSRDYIYDPIVPNTPQNIIGIFMNEIADGGIAMIMIVGCYVVFFFGNDLKQRCVNYEILSGNSRQKAFCSHYLSSFLLTGTIIVISLVIGCCKYGIINWFMQILENKLYFIRTVLLIYIISFSIISFCMVFSVILKDTAKSTIAAFVFLFISCYIMAAFASTGAGEQMASAYEKTSGLLLLYPPYLWRWVLNPNLSIAEIVFVFFASSVWCGLSYGIGNYLYCKTELK